MFSQVQTDKVPMPAPNESVFEVARTLQPSGTQFDPPARISLPNANGGKPGEEQEMFTFDHDLMEWVSIGPGVVSDDGSRITSREGFGVRHAGWGGAPPPPPPPTCNIKYNDGDECTSDSKNDCFCTNKLIPDKVKSDQTAGNCQTELCSGSRDNNSDIPDDEDVKGDCKKPGCETGSPKNVSDDSDISEEDAKCSKCEEGNVVADESKNDLSCGSGPEQACLVCVDGTCEQPECDRGNDITSRIDSDPLYEKTKRFAERTIRRIPVSYRFFRVTGNLRGSLTKGERCCKDCSKGPDPQPYTRLRGTGIVDIQAGIFRGVDIPTIKKGFTFKGYGLEGEFKFKMGISGSVSVRPQVSLSGEYTEVCEEGCLATAGGLDASIAVEVTGIDSKVSASAFLAGIKKDIVEAAVKLLAKARIGKTGGSYQFVRTGISGECPSERATWFVGAGTIEGSASATFKLFGIGVSTYQFNIIHEAWQPLAGSDNTDQ